MSFAVWIGIQQDGICKLEDIKGVKRTYALDKGESRAGDWPATASCAMSPRAPKDVKLADSLFGTSLRVISARLKQALEDERAGNIEFLPLTIKDHKKRVASRDYFAVNPQDFCDCIDQVASRVEFNTLDPTTISYAKSLVLREQAIPPELKLFRLQHWPSVVVIRRDLADKLTAGGFTGLYFMECREYNGLY